MLGLAWGTFVSFQRRKLRNCHGTGFGTKCQVCFASSGWQATVRMTLTDILVLNVIVAKFEFEPNMAISERLDGLTEIII